MKRLALLLFALCPSLFAQDKIVTKTTYAKAYGATNNAVAVDPAKDLPRYPAVEPKDAIGTWQVKKGFKLQLAAHEPQVRDPIAICFDERGRMFVCEMIDYSEMRDVTPHLGRISMLQDKDGDGYFETSQVFADDLPWPTGLIWANGGLFVGATPDIWRFEDKDGDGKAEVREKVFTGFGTGLKILNVQGLMNSFQWGQDNKVHILAGGGNRGVITCLKRPDDKGIELGGKDFWFDPRTLEFGLEGGGAQYGMSFDNYGRKFGCSNSDHLQYWVYDDKYANRNPYYQMPPARQSIAVDGGAAEVFRLSPDEPWRIIRTRWRIAGVVKGAVEGGGRVSGYFTGATGTTIYRGDAYGPDFVNNSFSGDAGGQLVHRKIIKPSADGISLIGERPADEHGFEFAASKDTWVRVVNFANAPDGCLHICDMYREVIEHPWSIPDEIKKHIDLNNGNDRGRIYRIVPEGWQRAKGEERRGNIAGATTEELVKLLSHPNGWHRDTAQRLLFERQDKAAVPMLEKVLSHGGIPAPNKEGTGMSTIPALAKLHALNALESLGALTAPHVVSAGKDADAQVREAALRRVSKLDEAALSSLAADASPRVRFQTALAAPKSASRDAWLAKMAREGVNGKWMSAAVLGDAGSGLFEQLRGDLSKLEPSFAESLITLAAAEGKDAAALITVVTTEPVKASWVKALGDGLRRAGSNLTKADNDGKLAAILAKAAETATNGLAGTSARLDAIELLGVSPSKESEAAVVMCLGASQPDAVQTAAIRMLAQNSSSLVTANLIGNWAHYGPKAQSVALEALLARDDRAVALLEAKVVKPEAFSAAQVQALIKHKSPKVAAAAKTALASVIPPSREEMAVKFKPAVAAKGDATKGQLQFMGRCMICHKAGANGFAVGPDLITVKTKGREALLEAILMPHKEVASQYIAYTVNTKDGQTIAGVISNDTASSMTLKMPGGAEKTLQRSEIKGSSSSGQSLMPEGLETGMTVVDMADLLSFIEGL
ncbi:MAG: c-type cytochrome [Prosthecobacter sp.]|jgi:putative membrane-bound dehydrogenase-like protein|uniref:PVC-type heme-binding CxxCH protein n=1 Tax=Prosthecobacter sp. TaxID=1965333 RepID=UPI0019FC8260|nr:PVC-type heme-binding CxxCH protein [Prosthecobacter sp.]MBE2282951.1 c-type cytochrome [Prosthecobacter sp.]